MVDIKTMVFQAPNHVVSAFREYAAAVNLEHNVNSRNLAEPMKEWLVTYSFLMFHHGWNAKENKDVVDAALLYAATDKPSGRAKVKTNEGIGGA